MIDRREALTLLATSALVPTQLNALPPVGRAERLVVGERLARFDLLRPGARSYLISHLIDGKQIAQMMWRREVRFDRVDGRQALRIVQHWDGVGAHPTYVDRDSTFEMDTFRPASHFRTTVTETTRTVEAYLFGEHSIDGLPDVPNNARTDFHVASAEPMYNFETDMEMLQTLPWEHGYAVSIPFFHPAPGSVPARYLWSASGEEALTGPDGRSIPCWIVTCDYNTGQAPTRFWLAKRGQALMKMEGPHPAGGIHRKTLLW